MQVRPPSIKISNNDKRRKNQGADLCVRGPENKHAKQKRITTIKLQNSSLGQAYKDFGGVKNSSTRNTIQLCTSIKVYWIFIFNDNCFNLSFSKSFCKSKNSYQSAQMKL